MKFTKRKTNPNTEYFFLVSKYFINMFMFTPGQTSTATLSIYKALLHKRFFLKSGSDSKLFQKQKKKGYNNEQKLCVGMKHCFLMHALIYKALDLFGSFSNSASSTCACAAA